MEKTKKINNGVIMEKRKKNGGKRKLVVKGKMTEKGKYKKAEIRNVVDLHWTGIQEVLSVSPALVGKTESKKKYKNNQFKLEKCS